ncbi:hypothetical protein D3C75_1082420 [compost metagenome]
MTQHPTSVSYYGYPTFQHYFTLTEFVDWVTTDVEDWVPSVVKDIKGGFTVNQRYFDGVGHWVTFVDVGFVGGNHVHWVCQVLSSAHDRTVVHPEGRQCVSQLKVQLLVNHPHEAIWQQRRACNVIDL